MEFADARAITPEAPVLDDNKKLEMLGYDATLGRPFGFWSALGLSMANLSFVFDTVVFCTMYGYPAPMMFVSIV
jgi:hypothetical protein